jgi:hypothetical protein
MSNTHNSLAVLRKLNTMSERKRKSLQHSPNSEAQKSALRIMEREEEKAKKSRLQSLLLQQFIGKYGSKNAKSEINGFINDCINRFIGSKLSLSSCEQRLPELEDEIRTGVDILKSGIRETKQREQLESKQRADTEAKSRNGSAKMGLDLSNMRPGGDVDTSQWAVLNTLVSLSDEDRQRQERAVEMNKKLKHKEELDKQQQYRQEKAMEKLRDKENSLKTIQK